MEIRITGTTGKQATIAQWNEVSINFKYNCITDTFGFRVFFDPTNNIHRDVFKPSGFQFVQIYDRGQMLLAGTILNVRFETDETLHYVVIEGYNLCGVLADCYLTSDLMKILHQSNVSLKNIVTQISEWFNLPTPVIDKLVEKKCNSQFAAINWESTNGSDTRTYPYIKDKLVELCTTKDVILSHTATGAILLTMVKSDTCIEYVPKTYSHPIQQTHEAIFGDGFNQTRGYIPPTQDNSNAYFDNTPIWCFQSGDGKTTSMKLNFNGQPMHSDIEVYLQQGNQTPTPNSSVTNPYCKRRLITWKPFTDENKATPYKPWEFNNFRPRVDEQKAGNEFDSPQTALQLLGNELENITVVIEMQGWYLNNKLIRPNCIVEVYNPNIYIYKKTQFFVQEVNLNGNERGTWATVVCCLPDCFQDKTTITAIKNIFD